MPKFTDKSGLHVRRARWHYANEVGTVEVIVPVTHLIADPGNPQGTLAGLASEDVFKAYATRLLEESTRA